MSKTFNQKPLAAALGAAFLSSVVATAPVQAGQNPFAANQLSSGYMQVAMDGKCGGTVKKDAHAKCGANMKKKADGKCGGDKVKKKADGKCGTGKCGGSK